MLLVMLAVPSPRKLFVLTRAQFATGSSKFVALSTTYGSYGIPPATENTMLSPATEMLPITGGGLGSATTRNVPSTSNPLVFHFSPGPGDTGEMFANEPE